MEVERTDFNGLFILNPNVISDSRGYFMESFNHKALQELGLDTVFVQDNQSFSRKGVLRGLHYQQEPYAQAKLVRVLSGTILDVVVDIRIDQPTFGKHFSVELSSQNKKQLFMPKGFAHGFCVLSDTAEILYKCDEYYHPKAEGGILYNDPVIGIDWVISEKEIILSGKDQNNPRLMEALSVFK